MITNSWSWFDIVDPYRAIVVDGESCNATRGKTSWKNHSFTFAYFLHKDWSHLHDRRTSYRMRRYSRGHDNVPRDRCNWSSWPIFRIYKRYSGRLLSRRCDLRAATRCLLLVSLKLLRASLHPCHCPTRSLKNSIRSVSFQRENLLIPEPSVD